MEQINSTKKTNLSSGLFYRMLPIYLKQLFLFFCFLHCYQLSFAQNNLAAGDVAIVSYQSDFDPTNTFMTGIAEFEDRFSLIITKPGGIAAGTVLFFTTRGWHGPNSTWHDEDFAPFTFGLGRRAVVQWTVPAGGISQGTEIFFINTFHDELPVGSEYYSWAAYANEAGTTLINNLINVTPIVPGANSTDGMSFATSGDKLLIYQTGPPAGPNAGPNSISPIRFITALLANLNGTTISNCTTTYAAWDAVPGAMAASESSVPPGLVNGQTCYLMSPSVLPAFSNGITEPDNGKFNACSLSLTGACTALEMSTIIYATNPAGPDPTTPNWTYSNAFFPLGTSSSFCTYNILSANTITLSSAVGTNAQTVCINSNITNITYNTTGATGATFSGLPTGVNGNWSGNVVTISGTPMVSGNFNYTVTTTGGCSPAMASGTITVNPQNTISAGVNRTTCINTAITPISLGTTGATGAIFSGLPTGVNGNWSGNIVTISGTPMVSGSFNYTVTTTGGCPPAIATGNITVNALNTINLTSGVGTNAQTVLINTPIANITYATTGATGATFSGLPTGVTGNWAANVVTISGSPSTAVSSPYNYTVTLTGGCGMVNASGTITVNTCSITEQTVSANPLSECTGGSSTITVGASQAGVNYTLQLDPANTFVAGPTASNGSPINFSVGPLASTTTYNILAETDKYSVYLNGSEAGFLIPQVAPLDLTNNFTIEGWIKPDAISAAYSRLFNKSQSYALGLSSGQTNITFTRHNSGDYSVPFAFTSGQWYHIACTYVSGTVEFFVNGVSVGTVGGVPAIAISNQGAQIGSESSSFHQFKGNIDNVRIWNNVRTQAEINANQSAFLTSTGNPTLVANWWIIEGTGNAKDFSTNAINATSLNGTWQVDSPVTPCSLVLANKPTVNVNAIPDAVATPSAQTVCSGVAITTIVLSGSVGGTVYNWTRDNTVDVTGIAASGTGDISGSLTNTTASPITVTFTITPTAGCSGPTTTATVLVNPTPTAMASPSSQDICSGETITPIIVSGNAVSGVAYNWVRDNNIDVSGIAASGSGSISGSLTNASILPINVTFTITPMASCTGPTTMATVLVNPTPIVNNPIASTGTIGTPFSQTFTQTGGTPMLTFSTVSTLPAGLMLSSAGVLSGTPSATGTFPIIVTVTDANMCLGTGSIYNLMINCPVEGTPDFFEGFESGSFTPTWTLGSGLSSGAVTTTNPASGLYRLEGTGGTSTHLTGFSTNITPVTPSTISWDIFPTGSGATNYFVAGNNSVSATNCVMFCYWQNGNNIRFVSSFTFVYSATPGQWYHIEMRNINWITHTFDIWIDNVLVQSGFPFRSASQNNLSNLHLYNFNSGVGVWDNIQIGESAPIATPSSQNVCNGSSITPIVLSGASPGATYNWTRDNTASVVGIPASGTGDISGILTNTTASPVTVTFTITTDFYGVCMGTPFTATVVVNSFSTIADGDYFAHSTWSGGCAPPNPIPLGVMVFINHSVTNTASITNNGTLTNNGILTNSGTLINNGTFTNNGAYKGRGNFVGNFVNSGSISPGN